MFSPILSVATFYTIVETKALFSTILSNFEKIGLFTITKYFSELLSIATPHVAHGDNAVLNKERREKQ